MREQDQVVVAEGRLQRPAVPAAEGYGARSAITAAPR
jgi:hypothetical protein